VNFEPVPGKLVTPDREFLRDLSDDQRLLLEYSSGDFTGKIHENFVHRKPGPVSHSRG
jgi:hypothetical protein